MPWQYPDNVPGPAKNWDKEAQQKCTAAANAVLRDSNWDDASEEERKKIEQNAIFACIRAAGKSKVKELDADIIIQLAEQNPELSDFQLVEKALGEGQGVGGPTQGVGGVDVCYCDACDKEFEHERGTPCNETPCPECGEMMGPVLEKKETQEVTVDEQSAIVSKFFTVKGKDNRDYWVSLSGGSFQDREDEFLSRKAIDYGIKQGDKTGERGELRLYHYPNSRVGECNFQMRQGCFLIEAGLWDETHRAQKAKEWVERNNPDSVGISVGFFYNPKKFIDNVYTDEVVFFERSVLKREHASFPWSSIQNIRGGLKEMSHKKELVEMLGGDKAAEKEVNAILEGADEATKELENQGVAFKETEEKAVEKKEVDLSGLSEDELKALYVKIGQMLKKEEKEVEEEVETKEVEQVLQLNEAAIKAIAEAVAELIELPDTSELETEVKALKEITESVGKKMTEEVEARVKETFEQLPKATIYRATKVVDEEPGEVTPQWINPLERSFEDGIKTIEQARKAGR